MSKFGNSFNPEMDDPPLSAMASAWATPLTPAIRVMCARYLRRRWKAADDDERQWIAARILFYKKGPSPTTARRVYQRERARLHGHELSLRSGGLNG